MADLPDCGTVEHDAAKMVISERLALTWVADLDMLDVASDGFIRSPPFYYGQWPFRVHVELIPRTPAGGRWESTAATGEWLSYHTTLTHHKSGLTDRP